MIYRTFEINLYFMVKLLVGMLCCLFTAIVVLKFACDLTVSLFDYLINPIALRMAKTP